MMGLPDNRKRFQIGLAVLIQYRRVTDSHPASHVAVASTALIPCADKRHLHLAQYLLDWRELKGSTAI